MKRSFFRFKSLWKQKYIRVYFVVYQWFGKIFKSIFSILSNFGSNYFKVFF